MGPGGGYDAPLTADLFVLALSVSTQNDRRNSVMKSTTLFAAAVRACCVCTLLFAGQGALAAGMTFSTTLGPGMIALASSNPAMAANMQAGFLQAQSIWSSYAHDPININLVLDYKQLDSGTLASTSSPDELFSYTDVRNSLQADRTSATDFTAVANLPTGSNFALLTNARDGSKYLINSPTVVSSQMFFNRANAKALGLLAGNDPTLDGSVTFNSLYANSWGYTHTPTPGRNDFIGVALHEIGHALGFTSGVSNVDLVTGVGPYAELDLNDDEPGIGTGDNIPNFTVLDLFRHSAASNAIGPMVLDLAAGGTPFFQINGSTPLGNFSTGEYNGDGRQPSHWKSNVQAVMKPSHSSGTVQDITPLDLLAFDAMGYDLIAVPEPATFVLAAFAAVALCGAGARRRRQSRGRQSNGV